MNFYHTVKNKKRGFTLIEMIVVLALIITLTAIILFNNAKLNSAVLVSNTAYEIGLIVRESQIAGLGVKASNISAPGGGPTQGFTSSHGVHIDMNVPTEIMLFADSNNDKIYDSMGLEITQQYKFGNKRSGTILAICGKLSNSSGSCSTTNTSFIGVTSADIVFTRPNPEALFKIRRIGSSQIEEFVGALIINIGFANDICRSITIEKTGAVQIDTAYCPPVI